MIKITRTSDEGDDVTRLRVDGRLLATTADELERACRAGLTERWPLLLDFAGVSFVDADAARVVAMLVERGAVVVGASPFVSEILRTCVGPDDGAGAPREGADGDTALLARLRRGDEHAFDEMTRRYAGRMLAVARRLLRSDEDARDAVQEAFVSAFKSLDRFHGDAKISTWLHRIVVNAALMRLRTRKRKPEQPIEDLLPRFDETGEWATGAEPPCTPDDALERREVRETVRRCIDLLPESYRAIILLRDIEELDGEETAAALGLSMSAVKSRLHRARQALHTLLTHARLDTAAATTNATARNRGHDAASHDRG